MSINNVSGASANSHANARKVGANSNQQSGRKTANDVLATLREMKPGWTISTCCSDWGAGARNIQIDVDVLERMANDPREMRRVKALMQEFEGAVSGIEDWKAQNPGQFLEIGVSLAAGGNARALAAIKTLMGEGRSIEFDLPNGASWMEIILQNLEALNQNEGDAANQSKCWNA